MASVQTGSAIARTLFHQVGPGGAVLVRLLFAAVILLILGRRHLPGASTSAREVRLIVAFGLVLGAMNLTFYEAIDRIPLGIGVAIEFVGPLAVAIAGSRRRIDGLWVALAAAGIVAMTHGRAHGLDAFGVVLALCAGACWAGYILLNSRVGRAFSGSSALAPAMCIASLVAVPVGLAEAGSHLLEPRPLLLGLAVAVLSSVVPYSLEIEALRRIATSVFGVLMSMQPAVAALAGFLVLGQSLSARALVGIALVVFASVGASLHRARRGSPASSAEEPPVPTWASQGT